MIFRTESDAKKQPEPDVHSDDMARDDPDQDAASSDSGDGTTTNSEIKAAEEARTKALTVRKMNAMKKKVREREKRAQEQERKARELEKIEAMDAAIRSAKKKAEEEKKRKKGRRHRQ
jgi:hypothetical protein